MNSEKPKLCEETYFDAFYKEQLQAIHNFAFYKCGNKDTSLDLVQDAFSKIWTNCASIDVAKAKTYLFTTVNNLFLNNVRHEKVVLNYAKASSYQDTTNQNPEYLMEEEEFKKKLQTIISGLSPEQREIFLLNRIEGKKYREIAELLNISQKTVEKRMSGALKILREKLKDIKI